MESQAPRLLPVNRTLVLPAVTALLIASAVLPIAAQNSVPPTAVQAARMPEFAKRLAHPAGQAASRPNGPSGRAVSPNYLPPLGVIYENGPINGMTDAWGINFGFVVSDTFTVNSSTVNGMTFGAWLTPGDTLRSVELSITSEANGGTSYFNQFVNLSQTGCVINQYGSNVCTVMASFTGPTLRPGTYWVNLQNAQTNTGNPVYWDENSGVGCQSNGCPSQAESNVVGTIPSESFSVIANNGVSTCFHSHGNLQIIHDFTEQEAGRPTGVTIDNAGNLYGTTFAGGDNGAGFAYKLAHFGDWLFQPLFDFLGSSSGDQPSGVIVGSNGSLYGGAQGGIQNCGSDGSQYCGIVFNLRPQPTACATALCSWTENVPYRFTSEADGSGVINVSAHDQRGNLYGTTSTGGAFDAGTVFELTPSGGGWTKNTLYSFTGNGNGDSPTQVLFGNDGNLYGVAGGGIFQGGIVFQLTPSGNGQWTESLVHAFNSPFFLGNLVQDSAGNLYGIDASVIFVLQREASGWSYSGHGVQHDDCQTGRHGEGLVNLTIDAAGNLYGTGSGGSGVSESFGQRSPGNNNCVYNYIFKARYDSNGWQYQDLDFLLYTDFRGGGSLALDAGGNLYGTTSNCGAYNHGTVWEVSP